MAQDLPQFEMKFEPMTIEHLGLRLYSTLPPAISELISNAYDAESPKVEVILPNGSIEATSEVIVRDYGVGMAPIEVQDEFLPIGRNRRGTDGSKVMSKTGKVHVTGRKGLGKLSAFGVADEMEIRAVQGGYAVCLRLNYSAMKTWSTDPKNANRPYRPTVVKERTGSTKDPNGVEVTLRKLHRTNAINEEQFRRGLARRLSVIGPAFTVLVNGKQIQPGDRLQRSSCKKDYSWDVESVPGGATLANGKTITGWIGFVPSSSSTERGVDIFANKKAAELGSFFNYPTTHAQYARAYLVGEIHADFLDEKDDLISTARNSVVWESEGGQLLQAWGRDALKWAFDQWLANRHKEKEEQVITVGAFNVWLAQRLPQEQRVARRMLKLLVDDENLDPESAAPLLEIIKVGVETTAFRDLVDEIENESASVMTLLRLFDEWRIIEAREHLKLADGRTAAIDKLTEFMQKGALEVTELQPLFEKNLWLLDPAWKEVDIQPTYTKLLREKCKEPKDTEPEDRRLDIFGVKFSRDATVVELKRPEKTLSRADLEQIEKYTDFARAELMGSGEDAPTTVRGLLLVGKLNKDKSIHAKIDRLRGSDIRVETYRDLQIRAQEYYGIVEKELKKVAPEYSRARRKGK